MTKEEKAAKLAKEKAELASLNPPQPEPNEAPENEKEVAAREAALEKATAANNRVASKIATDWARNDKGAKEWMIQMGARCQAYLIAECAIDTPYAVALGQLAKWTLQTTGESKSADITRCVKLYFASLAFGEGFARLSVRGQKELATLLESATDDKSKVTIYVLTPKTELVARAVFQVCTGAVKEVPEGIERLKDGAINGDVIAQWVSVVKAGRNPLTESKDEKKAAQEKAKAAKEVADKKAAAQAGKGDEETATGERPESCKPTLDVKPAVAGGQLTSLLAEHEAGAVVLHAAGKNKEFTATMVESIIVGMVEAGRIDDVRHIIQTAGRELRIAIVMEKTKATRQDAIKTIDEQDARRAA